jgi:hypothetical protein
MKQTKLAPISLFVVLFFLVAADKLVDTRILDIVFCAAFVYVFAKFDR